MNYELTTLKDIFERVPANRIEDCMKELATGMVQAKVMRELLTLAGSAVAEKEVICEIQWPDFVTWIDDGAGKIDLAFRQGIQMAGSNAELRGATDEPKQ